MNCRTLIAVAGLLATLPTAVQAQTTLFSDNLDSTSGTAYSVIFSNATANYGTATFGFDYSALGIPSAPNSTGGTTRGLMLQANKVETTPGSGTIGGVSVSPTTSPINAGLTNYAVRFDLWMNANGAFPGGGTGSTQHAGVSIGTTGTTHQFPGTAAAPGNVDGVTFAASGEGGASGTSTTVRDYNAWVNAGAFLNNTGYAAAGTTPQDQADPYYANFGNVAPPGAQGGNQTGNTLVGSQGFEWHTWTVTREGNTVRWFIRDRNGTDVLISTVDISAETLAGTNFTLGQYDFFSSVAPAGEQQFLFGLYDNVVVFTPVPEPTTVLGLAAAGLAGIGWVRRRRRASY
ncbi:MAG TPA: PEP-CTERM sorting domain-containing protein [Fimbriiglobus sp.]|nr:PEP-CTERM sorting domain-containing protein [Fimbriiglobus sp.]